MRGNVLEYFEPAYTCTSALVSSQTSESFSVPRNCKLGRPRIVSKAKASGLSSSLFEGVLVTFESDMFVVKLSPSRTRYESGSESAPRYKSR